MAKLTTFLAPYEHVLCTCSQSFQVFRRIQVQIGDTRRVFFVNPLRSLNDLTTAISREIPKTRFMDFGLIYKNDERSYVVLNDDPLELPFLPQNVSKEQVFLD